MKSLKNYFVIFSLCFVISLISKFIFAFYNFADLPLSDITYAVFYGYKFDFAISAIIALLSTFVDFNKKMMLGLSFVLIIALFCFLMGDTMYFSDSSRHISYEIKDALAESEGLIGTAIKEYTGLLILSFVGLVVVASMAFYLLKNYLQVIKLDKFYLPWKLLLIAVSVFFIRGMFQHIPLDPWHAYRIGEPKLAMISLNSAYNAVFQNIRNKGDIQITPKYSVTNEQESIQHLYQEAPSLYQKPMLDKPNIVVFFLESWSAAFFKDYGSEYDVAPKFSEILAQSIRPKAMIANGHRTVEGVFSTLTSFQNPLGKSVARTSLQSFKYKSLLDLLNKEGYSSAFFQGSNAGTAAGSLAQNLGFHDSYGRHDIKERIYEENHWGVHDPDLYNFVVKKIEKMHKPFIVGINGATTHDVVLPKGVEKIHFTDDEELNDILNTYHFSDQATYDFIKQVEQKYPNTLFVLLADHTARLKNAGDFLNYLIPFAIYSPKLPAQYIDSFISQRDIAPTLTDLVLGDYRKLAPSFSGKSLIREHNFFGDFYSNGILGLVKNNVMLKMVNNQIKCFDVSDFKPKEITCPQEAATWANEIKSFTNAQQELLFKGKTQEFSKFREAIDSGEEK